ncbi:jerky protein-like [Anoplolepis gracilipes]|uniref:jerky protein-like n=1 Tax=Anoplolepis gracilipes TaxID=354296 RepID=UPI003BA3C6D7
MAKMSQNVSGSYQEFYEKMKQDCDILMAKMSENISKSSQEFCEKIKQGCNISMAKMSQNVSKSFQEFCEKLKQECNISMDNMFQNVSRSLQEFDGKMKQETGLSNTFKQAFIQLLKQENISRDNIYFMLLVRLNFNHRKRVIMLNEANMFYMKDDGITSIVCANITGSHKLDPYIIVKLEEIEETINRLKNQLVPSLEVVAMSNDNVLLEEDIFVNWYNIYFTTRVIEHHQQKTNSGKVLLLLKNSEKLNRPPEKIMQAGFETIFFPVSCLPNLQPLHEKIVNVLKNKHIFQTEFEDFNYNNFSTTIFEIWTHISSEDIKNSWNQFLKLDSHTEENTPSTSFIRH